MIIEPLKGRAFDLETANCYTLVRDFYRLNYGIDLSDIPCPGPWWNQGLDIYPAIAVAEGFQPITVHPSEWRPGDVIMMAIQARVGNHLAVLLPNSHILHHMFGQLSSETMYGGLFRNNTLAVYRHTKLMRADPKPTSIVDLESLLPAHVKSRLAKLQPGAQAAETLVS